MISLFITAISILIIGAVGSLVLNKDHEMAHMMSSISAIIAAILGISFSLSILYTKTVFDQTFLTSFPLFTISFHIDQLAAFFIFIISLIALPASLYGIGYMKSYYGKYSMGLFGLCYNLFFLSLLLVVTAYNGVYFLFVWEIMSLTSLFLVLFENKEIQTIKAGVIYFIMTHVATVFLLVAFLLLYYSTGSFDFPVIQAHAHSIPFGIRNMLFFLFIIGFGTKAGIVPLHIWLPRAHSAAPSHVSALMSGVMIKMGIFMLFRMFLDILPEPSFWLGAVILSIGATSSVLGVLYALSEHDSKRLLAYHSIENIGIILLGLGSGLVFLALHMPALATLAIIAGLFHTVNHAIFKSLLFLGAGSVIAQTHTRNIEDYGGLIKRMPYTALFFLIGAIAISGLPPFNGFASEWLTFQSLFVGIGMKSMLIKSLFIVAGISLAITGGLAAACFVKAFGATFLARPRSEESTHAKESSLLFTISMGFLALLSLLFGIFAAPIVDVLRIITTSLSIFRQKPNIAQIETLGATIHVSQTNAYLNMPLLVIGICLSCLITFGLVFVLSRKQKIVIDTLWNCGYTDITPRMEITATGFSRSLIMIFKGLFKPTRQHSIEYVDAQMRYFSKSRTVTLGIVNIYENYLYEPLHTSLFTLSKQAKKIQGGNINQYLLYIFIVLIGLLVWARY